MGPPGDKERKALCPLSLYQCEYNWSTACGLLGGRYVRGVALHHACHA
eukprot:COSAG01_NODE_32161_length_585_cov_1.294239_1_plen_47_part_01